MTQVSKKSTVEVSDDDDSDDILYRNPRAGADIFVRSAVATQRKALINTLIQSSRESHHDKENKISDPQPPNLQSTDILDTEEEQDYVVSGGELK